MTDILKNQYLPDSVSPPGETLLEVLSTRGMSQAELADRTGITESSSIEKLLHGGKKLILWRRRSIGSTRYPISR